MINIDVTRHTVQIGTLQGKFCKPIDFIILFFSFAQLFNIFIYNNQLRQTIIRLKRNVM